MTNPIPLIRSAALFPMIRWHRANERSVEERLRAVDLGYLSEEAPERPIPLLAALKFFRTTGALEGPDAGTRVVTANSLADLGMLGRIILGSRTPRDALQRVAAALPRYCTHELLALQPIQGGVCVSAGWSLILDDETLHLTQQFTAALILALCAATGLRKIGPRSVRIRPHPVFGLDHLRPRFGPALAMARKPTLEIDLDQDVVDATLHIPGPHAAGQPPHDWAVLKGDGSLAHSIRLILESMIDDPPVLIERLVQVGGQSARSLQRALTSEGTSFRQLLDEAQHGRAMRALRANRASLYSVATGLGYSAQSSFSRAVRRWTGVPPKVLDREPAASSDKKPT